MASCRSSLIKRSIRRHSLKLNYNDLTMQLLLASKSPRRRELLSSIGYPIRFVDISVDEKLDFPVPSDKVAETLALLKSDGFSTDLLNEDDVLVTADTVVVHNDFVLGKPKDAQDAREMLLALSGDKHQVYTGVCLKSREGRSLFTEKTDVWFKELSVEEIAYYIDNYKPFDKAGAYGIQDWIGMIGISKIEGCYYNVMGLPMARLYKELHQLVGNAGE